MKDLTVGKPSRLILSFALPIFAGNVLQLAYSLIDTRIVGSFLGEDALAAVGATSSLNNLMIGFLLGMANGFAIETARCFGAKDMKGLKKSLAASVLYGVAIAALLSVLCLLFLPQLLDFLNIPADVAASSRSYISVILAGLVITVLYDVFSAAMRAIGDALTPLLILAFSVVLNIFGDWFFIVVLHTGVRGAAVATVLAQLLALLACFFYMIRRYEILKLSRSDFQKIDPEMTKKMLSSGFSMGFMHSLINIGSLTLQTAINKLGKDIIVAHTAARKISEIFMIMFSVFGQCMATYCSQNLGAGKFDRIRRGILISLGYTFAWSAITILASYTIGPWLVYLVTGSSNSAVIANATAYLKFDTLFYFVCASICIIRNAMQGIGDHITPLVSSSLEMIAKIVIAFTLVPLLDYTGVIFAEPFSWFIMVIPLLIRFFRHPLLKKH